MKKFIFKFFLIIILFYSHQVLSEDRWYLENSTGYHVWDHYDTCSSVTKSFVEMTECGKYYRNKFCNSKDQKCSEIGNKFVKYADTLAYGVKNKEINPNKAMLKFLEIRIDLEDQYTSGTLADQAG